MDPRSQRSRITAAGGLLAGITLLLSGAVFPTPARAADVENGRRLAQTACMECHSERGANPYQLDPAKLYAGGEAFNGPWGTVYSLNLTSDKETGIGNWTDAQVRRAITEGIDDEGQKLILMPWERFRSWASADLDDVIAFLRTLPAIKHETPADKLAPPAAIAGFIGSIPPLRAAVPQALYASPRDVFHDFVAAGGDTSIPPAVAGYTAPQGRDSVARGAYLARNVLGCIDCHSSNLAGGAPPFFAPNVTPDKATGIGNWSKESMVRLLREGVKPDGTPLSPIMPAGQLGYAHLSDDDVYNVVAYLQGVPAVTRAPGQPNPLFAPPPGAGGPAPAGLPNTGDPFGPWAAGVLGAGLVLALGGLMVRRRTA